MSKLIVLNILSDRPIAYHPDIARVSGSVKAGIFLSQLLYWTDKGSRKDGYIWKTQSDIEDETALTRYEQESARKELRDRGLLEEKKHGIPAKLHYRINTDILYALLEAHYLQTSMRENHILESGFTPDSDVENPQSITESTPKSTPESTTTSGSPDFAEVVKAYENNIAVINQAVATRIDEALEDYPKDWIVEAIDIAAAANKKDWRYINGILKRWLSDGRTNQSQQPKEQPRFEIVEIDGIQLARQVA